MKLIVSKNAIKELLVKKLSEHCGCDAPSPLNGDAGNTPIISVLNGELPPPEEAVSTIPHSGPPIDPMKTNGEENTSAPKIKPEPISDEEKLRANIRTILVKYFFQVAN